MKTNNIIIKLINILLSFIAVILVIRLYLFSYEDWIYILVPLVTVILSSIYKKISSFSKLYTKIIFDILLVLSYGIFLFLILGGLFIDPFYDILSINYLEVADLSANLVLIYIEFKILLVSVFRLYEDISKTKLFLTTTSLIMISAVLVLYNIAISTLDIYFTMLVFDNSIFLIMFSIIGLISTYDFKLSNKKRK